MSILPALTLVPLGTNGYFPSHDRQTMSFLVAWPGGALLLDAGSGLARLAEPAIRSRIEGLERLDIVLTHYHLDHVCGLAYLPGLVGKTPVRVFAPAPPLTTFGTEALDRLLGPPLFPAPLTRWPMAVEVIPFAGSEFEIGPLRIRARAQKHPGGSVGLRLGDELAYITDTILDLKTIPFVRGVGTLLHEVWLSDEEAEREDAGRAGHSAAGPVGDLARAAEVGRLLPVHHHPRRTREDLERLAEAVAARSGCPVEVPIEGVEMPLGAGRNSADPG